MPEYTARPRYIPPWSRPQPPQFFEGLPENIQAIYRSLRPGSSILNQDSDFKYLIGRAPLDVVPEDFARLRAISALLEHPSFIMVAGPQVPVKLYQRSASLSSNTSMAGSGHKPQRSVEEIFERLVVQAYGPKSPITLAYLALKITYFQAKDFIQEKISAWQTNSLEECNKYQSLQIHDLADDYDGQQRF